MSLPAVLGIMCPADSIIGFLRQADEVASVGSYSLDVSGQSYSLDVTPPLYPPLNMHSSSHSTHRT